MAMEKPQPQPCAPNKTSQNFDAKHYNANLDVLPYEIKVLIAEKLSERDLKSFGLCSVSTYNIRFALRAPGLTIALNPDTIKLFQYGGLCEPRCRDVRSIRLQGVDRPASTLNRWIDGWWNGKDWVKFEKGRIDNPEDTFSQLRTSVEVLALFPNLQSLCIYYGIPVSTENNTYLAVVKRLGRHKNLEHLDFQVIRFSSERREDGSNEGYEEIYANLSSRNQEFLGPKIPDDKIEQLVRANLPLLPNLKSYKLSGNCIASPMIHPQSPYYQKTGFYYLPLTAPQVEILSIETTDATELYNVYEFPNKLTDPPADDSPPGLLQPGGFPGITDLELKTCKAPDTHDLLHLAERFPNLKRLTINLFPNRAYKCGDQLETVQISDYLNIRALTNLQELELPWPRKYGGCTMPENMADLCSCWLENGTSNLEKITFNGMKHSSYGTWEDIKLTITFFERDDDVWDVKREGHVGTEEYTDQDSGDESSPTSDADWH